MQLKRWNIRKNATRKEWQQYFSNNEHRSIPTSIDASGTNAPPIILRKSTASKKRASRWVSGSLVEPSVSRASGSTLPRNAAQPIAASISHDTLALEGDIQPDIRDLFMNVANALDGLGSVPVYTDPLSNSMVTNYEPHAGSSQSFFDAMGGPAQILDLNPTSFHALPSPAPPEFQVPPGQDCFAGSIFTPLGMPAENNVTFFSMLSGTNFKRELPSAQLEHILRSKGIVLDKAAAHTIFGGFAPRYVAGILSSKDQSMVRQTPNLQHFLRKLSSQVPGESSALITDDQAFETKFARVLLFSMLNGFAGLDDVPMENILRFLNRFVVNKILLDILEQCPRHVSRTLADNIFRAGIEARDTNVVKLLLDRKLVDVNETVCFNEWLHSKRTPIQRASELISARLMQALIDAGADINKAYVNEDLIANAEPSFGALYSLFLAIGPAAIPGSVETLPPGSIEALNVLVAAGARVHPKLMPLNGSRTVEFDLIISQNVLSESHRYFFRKGPDGWPLKRIAIAFDDRSATILVQTVIRQCHEASCNKCLVDFGEVLIVTVVSAAETGKIELVQLLLDIADLEHVLPWILAAAIRSQNHTLIDFILNKAPDLDPPATNLPHPIAEAPTPIAEAVRHGNEDLIRRLEEGGSLDQLCEGGRFQVLVQAAVEVGNTAYMRKLLTRAVTSKQAYRVRAETLFWAIREDYQDIAQMLLEAGALTDLWSELKSNPLLELLKRGKAQMVRDLIAAGALTPSAQDLHAAFTREKFPILLCLVHEYPDMIVAESFLQRILSDCIRLDTLDFFKEISQNSESWMFPDNFLPTAVRFGNADMIGYLLDMGANPFKSKVLQAVIPDRPDILRLLFQKDRLRQTTPKCIGARILVPVMGDDPGNTEALDELIKTGAINFATVEELYHHDKRISLGEEYDGIGLTPLGLAIQGVPGKFDTNLLAMKKFLDAGANPDGISKSNERWTKGSPLMTALMVAVETGHEDAVNMLLEYGAHIDARPRIRTTRTALQYAAELGNMDMVRLLLSRGADVNSSASPRGGATALQFAAMSGNCNMVAHLLDHGAQLDVLPSRIDGMWPLEGAAANGRLDMISYLWELNVRAVARGTFPNGFSERHCLRAMNFARENGHIGCRDLISELSGVFVDRLETDEYGAPWIAYDN